MRSPDGSVTALSSASATVFSVGIVFLGYWGIHESTRWKPSDVPVVVLALIGFACLGFVPFVATRPGESGSADRGVRVARRMFAVGVAAIWLSVAVSVLLQ